MDKGAKLVVVQSNATTKETFITKLVRETKVDLGPVLGEKIKKETFYISTKKQAKEGDEVILDMNMFNVVERAFTLEEGENAGQEVMLKWLSLK